MIWNLYLTFTSHQPKFSQTATPSCKGGGVPDKNWGLYYWKKERENDIGEQLAISVILTKLYISKLHFILKYVALMWWIFFALCCPVFVLLCWGKSTSVFLWKTLRPWSLGWANMALLTTLHLTTGTDMWPCPGQWNLNLGVFIGNVEKVKLSFSSAGIIELLEWKTGKNLLRKIERDGILKTLFEPLVQAIPEPRISLDF